MRRRFPAAEVLDGAVALTLALAAVLFITPGLSIRLAGLRIGLHDWARPLGAALLLALAARRVSQRSARVGLGAGDAYAPRALRVALLSLVLASAGYWLVHLTTVCGGSDSYGYVSASGLILQGRLILPQALADWLPVANPLDVATPVGYVPAGDHTGIAPQYPLGLPALMALATVAAGALGPYLVAPATAAASLVLVWRIARAWYGPAAGWLAAALVAWDPLVVTYAKQPMSDVPAAFWWLAALWLLVAERRKPFAAGLAAAASFVTRPGGFGAMVALLLVISWPPRAARRRDAAWFLAGWAPGLVAQALLQWHLFGDPLTSGYGPIAGLYAGHTIEANLRVYLTGLWRTHSLVWVAGLVLSWLRPHRTPALAALAVLVMSGAPYVLYFQFDHWETLRFLLPAVVLLSITAAGGLVWVAERSGAGAAPGVALVLLALAAALTSERFLAREGVPRLKEAEARYTAVADWLRETTPARAVIFAAQHSGSIRHYAARPTLRWDVLRPEDLEPAVAALVARDLGVYVVLEGREQERFTARYAGPLARLRLLPAGQVRHVRIWELRP